MRASTFIRLGLLPSVVWLLPDQRRVEAGSVDELLGQSWMDVMLGYIVFQDGLLSVSTEWNAAHINLVLPGFQPETGSALAF